MVYIKLAFLISMHYYKIEIKDIKVHYGLYHKK